MQGRSELQEGSSQQRNSTQQITQIEAQIPGSTIQGRASRVWRFVHQVYPQVGACFWTQLLLCACLVGPAWSQLTEEQQESIVKLHNYYRRRTEPSAANMRSMQWDPHLKLQAEGYAVKCLWRHNPDLEDMDMGENLFAMTGHLEPSKALEEWFMEHQNFDYDNNHCTGDMMCGHYTQMVWAESYSVGCAVHHCDTIVGLDFENADFLVCNYFPAGNDEEERPYENGEWCSNCPTNVQRCDKNLCGNSLLVHLFFSDYLTKLMLSSGKRPCYDHMTLPPDLYASNLYSPSVSYILDNTDRLGYKR
ncbi:peptidase inhibitor 16-like [Aplochiton taeniatus]